MGNKESKETQYEKAKTSKDIPHKLPLLSEMQKRVSLKKSQIYRAYLNRDKDVSISSDEKYEAYNQFLTMRNVIPNQGILMGKKPNKASSKTIMKQPSLILIIPNISHSLLQPSKKRQSESFRRSCELEEEKYPETISIAGLSKRSTNEIKTGEEANVKPQYQGKLKYESKFSEHYLEVQAGLQSFPQKETISLKNSGLIEENLCQNFDYISFLPSNIFLLIISFNIDNFRNFLCVNPSWYCAIFESFEEHFNKLENSFINIYSGNLLFKDSFTSSTITKFCDIIGTRIDRIIRCENLKANIGTTVTIGYRYKYLSEKATWYNSQYTFDAIEKRNKLVWIYNNECSFHGDETVRACTPPIFPVCIGENIEIAVNYYSLRGIVDIDSIEWEKIKLEKTPSYNIKEYQVDIYREIEEDTSNKVFADLSRICELEDSEKWRDLVSEKRSTRMIDNLKIPPLFAIREMEFSDQDISSFRITLEAIKVGKVPYNVFGIDTRIVGEEEECTNEVKREGLLIERHAEVQLRCGDVLLFYYAKSNS